MASRSVLPEVGSPQWIFNELADAHRKEADHFEDFTIAFRNELEWLTEHMAEVFTQGSTIDITELYKTPGKLRGKTPRNPQKIGFTEEQKGDDVFVTPPVRAGSLVRPERGLINKVTTPQLKQSFSSGSDSIISTPELMMDSGSSAAGSFGILSGEPVERSSPAKIPSYQNAPNVVGETAERRICSETSQRLSLSAEGDHIRNRSDDIDGTTISGVGAHDNSPRNLGDKDNGSHASVSLVARVPTEVRADSPMRPSSSQPPPEPTQAITREFSVSPVLASTPVAPSSPISPIQQTNSIVTPRPLPTDQVAGSDTPSEAASPTGVARSNMNFASLPARETLTYKKSMGGSNPTGPRSSHVDDRASFFGRPTGGKSLGEIGLTDTPSASRPTPIAPSHHHTSDEEDEDEDLNEQLRLAEINKASVMQFSEKNPTQRLDEKIKQLSQQSTSRLSKSTSTSSILAVSQSEECSASKPTTTSNENITNSELSQRPRASTQSDEGDWIPSLPHVLKAPTAHSSGEPSSPIRLVPDSPSRTAGTPPRKAIMTPVITKLPMPASMNKKVLDSQVSYPSLPAQPLLINEAETPSKARSLDDLETAAAKKIQPNIFSLAKQLLWRSPKPTTSSKETSQNPNSEANRVEEQSEDAVPPSKGAANQALYPEIQSALPSDSDDGLPPEKIPRLQKGGLIAYGGIPKREVQLKGPSPAVIDGINLIPEHADDILRSPVVSDNGPSLPSSPFFEAIASDDEDASDGYEVPRNKAPQGAPPEPNRRSPQTGSLKEPRNRPSLQSKTSDLRKLNRGLFGVKDSGIAKPKTTQGSNIRLVNPPQREIDQRKNGHNPLSNPAALVNALAETFGPTKEPHARPLSAMSSSSTHSRQAPKSIAALNSAAKAQKREQEEKERKAAQRQEIERKRQENSKREEARREEERKQQFAKAAKKQFPKASDEEEVKRKIPTTGKGSQPLFHPSKLLPKTTPFSHKGSALGSSKSQPELKRQPKRVYPTEEESKAQGEENSSKDAAQQDSKRRKTEDAGETPASSTFAPPIRQSTAKKENLPPSKIGGIFSQDYTPAAHSQTSHIQAPSLVKPALPAQIPKSTPLPQVDAVKYSHDKLKFGTMVTPSAQKIGRKLSTVPRESPVYPNPESIELPEIHTDSEDDDDDKSFHVPKWADSPELRQALQDQLGIDPETIFGPIAPLSMEDIFRGRSDRAKFRARTSSANWSGADRLTTAEIEADRVERQRILDNGGWTYQKP
ncbi:hypothetical protein TWF281_010592 [Arthrobotrys megalospora]